jgi:pimeloyl-ACP methyl ester carboxylesterase
MRGHLKTWIGSLLALSLLGACAAHEPAEETGPPRFPVSSDYPPGTMERIEFTAGVPEAWRISALQTPARADATWKIVIITGTPSWSEYWAPTIAALPATREMIVADRPGFRTSQPEGPVRDIAKQAEALAPMLTARPDERVLLVGQSFGAPVATLMASRYPDRVHALVLMSSFFGDAGPTARRMIGVGRVVRPLLPRDLKNSISELSAQRRQLPGVREALRGLRQPMVFLHGDADTFVPLESARTLATDYNHTLVEVPGGDHFLNACCVLALLAAFEQAIAEAEGREREGQTLVAPAAAQPATSN